MFKWRPDVEYPLLFDWHYPSQTNWTGIRKAERDFGLLSF